MQIYNIYQSGKNLYLDEKENPDNKIVVNKYDNEQQTLRLVSDGTLPPRLYWALRNPRLSNKYFILKLINNEDLIVGTDISAHPGLWDMLLIGTDDDYIIEGIDIDQSRLTYVSDNFGRLFVRDNFLEELDFEEQCSPTFEVFYDDILDKIAELEKGGASDVEIQKAIEEYLKEHPIEMKVDNELSETSTNPVQNKVIAAKLKELEETKPDEVVGKDGVGVASAVINDNGELVLTYTDETITNLGVVVGKDGEDGQDGQTGEPGQNGQDGVDGKSAYEYAQDGGYAGTEEEFATKLAKDTYTKEEIDTMFGTYVDEVAELIDENLALLGGGEDE